MEMIKTKTNSGLLYETPECTSVGIETLVPLCVSGDDGNSGFFEEEIW